MTLVLKTISHLLVSRLRPLWLLLPLVCFEACKLDQKFAWTEDENARRAAAERYEKRGILVFSQQSIIRTSEARGMRGVTAADWLTQFAMDQVAEEMVAQIVPVGAPTFARAYFTNVGKTRLEDLEVRFESAEYAFRKNVAGVSEYPGFGGTCERRLDPGKECYVVVQFTPTSFDWVNSAMTARYGSGTNLDRERDKEDKLKLRGRGNDLAYASFRDPRNPQATVFNLGPVVVGVPLDFDVALFTKGGRDVGSYVLNLSTRLSIVSSTCTVGFLAMNSECVVRLRVSPTTVGAQTDKVTIVYDNGALANASRFDIAADVVLAQPDSPVPPPVVSSFSPTAGLVGAPVTIAGTNLAGATVIKFNTTVADILSNNGTQITANVPAGATSGKLSVTTPGGTAVSATNFTVNPNPAAISFSSSTVAFGRRLTMAYAIAPVQNVVVTNTGGTAANLDAISVTNSTGAAFSGSHNCGATLAAGAFCTVTVSFSPTAVAPTAAPNYVGMISVSHSGLPTPVTAALTGLGGNPGFFTANLATLDFGTPSLREAVSRSVVFTNCTTCAATQLNLNAMVAPYQIISATTASVNPGGTFTATVRFTPTAAGNFNSSLTMRYTAYPGATETQLVTALTANAAVAGKLVASTAALTSFGNVAVGATSAAKTFTLAYYGSDPITPMSIVSSDPNFVVGTYPVTIPVNALSPSTPVVVSVTFQPTGAGIHSGTITISPTNSLGTGTASVSVSGTGVTPAALSLSSLDFGSRSINGSYSGTVTVTNNGQFTANALSVGFSPAAASYSITANACDTAGTLAPAGTCDVTVQYAPTSVGATSATLVATFNNGVSVVNASGSVTGTGVLRAILAIDAVPDFGKVPVGTPALNKVATVRNVGSGAATSVIPSVSAPYSIVSHNCGAGLAAGGNCTVNLGFAPVLPPDVHNQSLTVNYYDGGAAQQVFGAISGSGVIAEHITAGTAHTCVQNAYGVVKCWGNNGYGQLGAGDPYDRGGAGNPAFTPVNFGGSHYAKNVFAGGGHTCAIRDDDRLVCWGKNDKGQLGMGSTLAQVGGAPTDFGVNLLPVDLGRNSLAAPFKVLSASAGFAHTCALVDTMENPDALANRKVKCWGANGSGQQGLGDTVSRGASAGQMGNALPFVAIPGYAVAVAAATSHTLVLANSGGQNVLYAFGDNFYGQLGSSNPGLRLSNSLNYAPGAPIALGSGKSATNIAVGGGVSSALLNNGGVKMFGLNALYVPLELMGTLGTPWCRDVNSLAVACVGVDPGNVDAGYGFQSNSMGDHNPEILLGSSFTASAVSSGGYHSCALSTAGGVKCWGDDGYGQLGQGDSARRGDLITNMGDALPNVSVGTSLKVTQVATGYLHTCVLTLNTATSDTGAKCWGAGQSGQLGYGDNRSRGTLPSDLGDQLPSIAY